MPVYIDELTTDVALTGAEQHGVPAEDAASRWEQAAEQDVARRRAAEIRDRTRSEGFDD